MARAGVAITCAFLAACAATTPSSDASEPSSDVLDDCYGGGNHIDCFGGFRCVADGICSVPWAPYYPPCPFPYPPTCPCSPIDPTLARCALGCRIGAYAARGADPSTLCIENRARIVGDPCRGLGDCVPAEGAPLECDLGTMRCAPTPDGGAEPSDAGPVDAGT